MYQLELNKPSSLSSRFTYQCSKHPWWQLGWTTQNKPNSIQMAVTKHTPNNMVASSLGANHIFCGFPGPITPTMAWNKLEDLIIWPMLEALGIIEDTGRLEVLIPL
jgi:hypothetical protein